jgi:hypothetical protein
MTHVYFSTVERAGVSQGAGEFILADFDAKQVLCKAPVVPTDLKTVDPNPRGGGRGGRGMWVDGDRVYGASRDRIHTFDRDLKELRSVSNGLLVGCHEVYMERPGFLWVAATNIDAAFEINLSDGEIARSYWPREDPRLQDSLGLTPMDLDKTIDNRSLLVGARREPGNTSHLHLNAVTIWNGEMHALFNELGLIVNLERGHVVIQDKMLHLGHNLVVVDDQLFMDSTQFRTVCQFDLPSGRLVRSLALQDLPWVRKLEKSLAGPRWRRLPGKKAPTSWWGGVAMPLFARGLQVIGDVIYVGIAPATILRIDWPRGELIDAYQYSTNVHVAVHGIHVAKEN